MPMFEQMKSFITADAKRNSRDDMTSYCRIKRKTIVRYKKAIALERAITVLKERASEAPDIPIVVREILEEYNNYQFSISCGQLLQLDHPKRRLCFVMSLHLFPSV